MKAPALPLLLILPLTFGCPGPECSDSTPCSAGSVCDASGRCIPSGSDGGDTGPAGCADSTKPATPNLLQNPGAECGTEGWSKHALSDVTLAVATDAVHGGTRALQITANKAGEQHVWNGATVNAGAGETWCAQAWMRGGTATDGRLTVVRGTKDKQVIFESYSSPVTPSEWAMVPPTKGLMKFTTAGEETLNLRVTLQFAQPGHSLIVDDVHLWKSPSGACTER